MQSEPQDHWNRVYEEKAPSAVSWFQPEPEPSLDALARLGAESTSSFIDVGGGASNLIDALLERGWHDLTVLDIAASAIEAAKERLGAHAENVHWEVADITDWHPGRQYDVWHDRAVFHFLVEAEQREGYRQALLEGVAFGGMVIIATFALNGPDRCSGLPVVRYDPGKLAREFGPSLELIESWHEDHRTPSGATQAFNWCAFRRQSA